MSEPGTRPKNEPITPGNDPAAGRALRRSLIVLLLIGTVVGGAFFLFEPKPSDSQGSGQSAGMSPRIPDARFTDVTTGSGLRFSHVSGAAGEKLLPETMGGGVAFLDFDNDGDQDLLFVNSTSWPGTAADGPKPSTSALYRNDGKGHFEDVTTGSGLDRPFYGMGVATGDYDNDGFVDVYLTGVGGNLLLRNEGGGRFKDVTAAAGVGGSTNNWSTSGAWIDYDNDGRLDLFVGKLCQLVARHRSGREQHPSRNRARVRPAHELFGVVSPALP